MQLKAFRKMYKRGNLTDPGNTLPFECIISISYLEKRFQGFRSPTTSPRSSTHRGHAELTGDVTESFTVQSNATSKGANSKHGGEQLDSPPKESGDVATMQTAQPQPVPSSKEVEPASYSHRTPERNKEDFLPDKTNSSSVLRNTTSERADKPLDNDQDPRESDKIDEVGSSQGKARQPNKRFQEFRKSHSNDESGTDPPKSIPLLAKKSASNLRLPRKQASTVSPHVSADRVVSPAEHPRIEGSKGRAKTNVFDLVNSLHMLGTDYAAPIAGDDDITQDVAVGAFKQTRDDPEISGARGEAKFGATPRPLCSGKGLLEPHKVKKDTSGTVFNPEGGLVAAGTQNGRQRGNKGLLAGESPVTNAKPQVQLSLPVVDSLWQKYKAELHADHKYFVQVLSSPL